MRNNCFVFPDFFSRNVGNSIKCEKNITPPPPQTTPTFEIQNQNKGIEDIMDIDSNWTDGQTGGFYFFLMLKIA